MSDVDQTVGKINKRLSEPRSYITLYDMNNSINITGDSCHNIFLGEIYLNAAMKIRVLTKLSFLRYRKMHHFIVSGSDLSNTSVWCLWKIKNGDPYSYSSVFLVRQISSVSLVF